MAAEAAAALKLKAAPSWALVLGSGLQEPDYFDPGSPVREWDFAKLPHFTCPTVPGHRGSLQAGTIAGHPVLVQRGRVHYYECLDFNTVTFYLRVLRELGVERVVLINAAGALTREKKSAARLVRANTRGMPRSRAMASAWRTNSMP